MTPKTKLHIAEAAVAVGVAVILWLLLRHAPITTGPGGTTVLGAPNISEAGPIDQAGNTYSFGLTTNPATYSLLFPGGSGPTATCGCGCDPDSALNSAFSGLTQFINQFESDAVTQANAALTSATQMLPSYITQYINQGA